MTENGRSQRDPLIGTVVDGRFHVLSVLGQGGMGAVYRAVQTSVEREVALKVISGEVTDQAVARFMREARTTSALSSVNTVTLLDFGTTPDGLLYLAMELLEGMGLDALLRAHGRLPWRRALRIAGQVALSLEEAHARGIVHRDLKPSNVFLVRMGDDPDFVKVLDFGIAKLEGLNATTDLTASGNVLGTPTYMSPEQARAEPVDGRSDLYSLGVILYQMLAGRPPFTADQPLSLLLLHCQARVPSLRDTDPPLDAPPGVIDLAERLLVKRREERIGSATELRRAIASLLGEPATGPYPPVVEQVSGTDATLLTPLTPRVTAAPMLPPLEEPETLGQTTGLQSAPTRRRGLMFAVFAAVALVVLAIWGISSFNREAESSEGAPRVESRPTVLAGGRTIAEEPAGLTPSDDPSGVPADRVADSPANPIVKPAVADGMAQSSEIEPNEPAPVRIAEAVGGGAPSMANLTPTPVPVVQEVPAAPSVLEVLSKPPGARVRDSKGRVLGTTPLELESPVRASMLLITHPGYERQRVKVSKGQVGTLSLDLQKTRGPTAKSEDEEPILDLMD